MYPVLSRGQHTVVWRRALGIWGPQVSPFPTHWGQKRRGKRDAPGPQAFFSCWLAHLLLSPLHSGQLAFTDP